MANMHVTRRTGAVVALLAAVVVAGVPASKEAQAARAMDANRQPGGALQRAGVTLRQIGPVGRVSNAGVEAVTPAASLDVTPTATATVTPTATITPVATATVTSTASITPPTPAAAPSPSVQVLAVGIYVVTGGHEQHVTKAPLGMPVRLK